MDQTDRNSIDERYSTKSCDTLMRLYTKTRGVPFRLGYIIPAIMDLIKIPNTKKINKRDPLTINPDDKEAMYIFERLLGDGLIRTAKTKYETYNGKKKKIVYYNMNKYKLKACSKRSGYYKKMQYKQKVSEKTKKLDYRKCELMLTLYGFFKEQPFTYTMVKNIFEIINNIDSDKYREKELLSYMRKRYTHKELLDIWNSLVQNNMIKKYKPKSTLKEKSPENEYKITKSYLEYCAKRVLK